MNTFPYLIDSGTSHHVIIDLSNLALHFERESYDDTVLSDGEDLDDTHCYANFSILYFTKTFPLQMIFVSHQCNCF